MENRRQHYRHEFAPTRQIAVRLQCAERALLLQAELINLSIGGMCVYASALRTEAAEKWVATLSFGAEAAPLNVPVERIYARAGDRACCGFRFLAADDLEEREKIIWKFLLDEQRRRRRFVQEA